MTDIGPTGAPTGGRRSSSSGFRTLLYVLVGLGAVLVVTCAAALYFAAQNPAVRQVLDAAMESPNAPGAAELRAAGCTQAVVMDLASAAEAIGELAGEAVGAEASKLPPLYVSCQLESANADLDCDEVARVYLEAVDLAPGRFIAQVSIGMSGKPECQVLYEADGRRLGKLEDVAPEL